MAKYEDQMNLILQNIFEKKEKTPKSNPRHWIRKMTNLVGGTLYQHAHADQAWPWELEGERTFPFVASHGFGKNEMEFWLLLKSIRGKSEYGFLHNLPRTAMLFMRGDFVHAGGTKWHPRCHMKFYPLTEAGSVFDSEHNYWQLPHFKRYRMRVKNQRLNKFSCGNIATSHLVIHFGNDPTMRKRAF